MLDSSPEFSTPVTSWRSVEEGIFLLKHNIDPYDGGVVYHSPLLIQFFALLQSFIGEGKLWNVMVSLVFHIIDLLISLQLLSISKKILKMNNNPKTESYLNLISLFYTFSPIKVLSISSKSTINFTNFCLTNCLYSTIVLENISLGSMFLATASYLSYNPIFLIIPFVGLSINFEKYSSSQKNHVKPLINSIIPFVFTLFGLIYASYYLNNENWNFLQATYGTNIFFTKINPNIGLWWYFFIEIFEFFSDFFIGVFNIYNLVYILPLTLRFQNCEFSNLISTNKFRIFPLILSYGCIVLTKPYPTLNDLSFIFELLILLIIQTDLKIINLLRYPFVSILLIIHAIILSPIFYYLWIFSGSGNSNFFYAINLVYSLGLGSTLIDFIWSYLSLEYLFTKNNGKEVSYDTKVRLTQI